ncbi:EthD domain-containing protein [Qipengyuania soli]|uniref:EthD domain-containing protein n=1 Tax=Qipengyuania soli TaxID=2782568 RepID=A0A7S8IV39_9SPHN|nr:EthD domain-containing protein [Qipengyuania soli]QPC99060.1 EthD domain-containing protein [Qipengyuania soli]
MIKLTYCLHRLPSLTREEFQRYWRETHAPLVAAASEALGIKRYVQCHTVESAIGDGTADGRNMPHGEGEDYDGVAELWFDSEDAVAAMTATQEGLRHAHILLEDERNFIDFTRSRAFIGSENVVIG